MKLGKVKCSRHNQSVLDFYWHLDDDVPRRGDGFFLFQLKDQVDSDAGTVVGVSD